MATIYVRDVPEDLYEAVKMLANEKRRSVSAQIIQLLEAGIRDAKRAESQARILDRIDRRRATMRPIRPGEPTSLDWLREDRAR
jgi:hypothetical protein